MKGKIIVALAIVAVALTVTGPANAGCAPVSKEFMLGFSETGTQYINFDTTDDQNLTGAVIGRLWTPGLFSTTNDTAGGGCADHVWLIDQTSATPAGGPNQKTIFGSNGSDFGNGLCDTGCFGTSLIVVVQTKSLDGTKGRYTAGRVLETSGGNAAYDFARTGDGSPATDWSIVDMPRPRVTVPVTGPGGNRGANVQVDLPDSAFHSAAADSLLANGTITGYQLVTFTGAGDPGREAALWTVLPGGLLTTSSPSGSVTLDCNSLQKVFVATRVVFDGGVFSSDYVSQSTVVNCSNLAVPGDGRGRQPIKKSLGN
jgi:hypothetical protein